MFLTFKYERKVHKGEYFNDKMQFLRVGIVA